MQEIANVLKLRDELPWCCEPLGSHETNVYGFQRDEDGHELPSRWAIFSHSNYVTLLQQFLGNDLPQDIDKILVALHVCIITSEPVGLYKILWCT